MKPNSGLKIQIIAGNIMKCLNAMEIKKCRMINTEGLLLILRTGKSYFPMTFIAPIIGLVLFVQGFPKKSTSFLIIAPLVKFGY